jgi:MtN3 and saliva related transmembrane protein
MMTMHHLRCHSDLEKKESRMTFNDPLEILGLIAGAFGTLASVPQAIKIIRTRSAEDVSLMMFLLAMTGCVLWGIYGWLKGAGSIIFWNGVAFVQFSAIIALKLHHGRPPE